MCNTHFDDVYGCEGEDCSQVREMSITIDSMREVAEQLVDSLYNDEALDEEIVMGVVEDFCRVLKIRSPEEVRLSDRTRQFAHGIKCVKTLRSLGMMDTVI